MSLLRQENSLSEGLQWLKQFIYIRSDNEDYIRYLCRFDHFGDNLRRIISNHIVANHRLERRIIESSKQDMAALTWDAFGQRHTGKSWFNFRLSQKILKARNIDNPRDTIIFKDSKGNIINTPSRWNDGIKRVADLMEHKHDGYRFALLQDELDPEWGEGRVKQSKNQNAAIDNLRKLKVLVSFAHVRKEDVKFNLDMRFLMLGYNKHTRIMAAVMHFTRPQGIVFLRIPENLVNYLASEYNEDAIQTVWDKAKNSFHQSAQNPDSDKSNVERDGISNTFTKANTSIQEWRYYHLQKLMLQYWMNDVGVVKSYARNITSFWNWKDLMFDGRKRKIIPAEKVNQMDDMVWAHVAKWWDVTGQSFNTANSDHKHKYEGYEYEYFQSHNKKEIGEKYAYGVLRTVLQNETEFLNPTLSLERDFTDKYIEKHGKSYDLALVYEQKHSIMAFNHKLDTSNQRFTHARFTDKWGKSDHPVRVIWVTRTRPFDEEYYVWVDHSRAGIDIDDFGLGTQSWEEVTFDVLISIIKALI